MDDPFHFAFDLDGTLTTAEILPLIAAELGLREEMALLTHLTLNGLIPFEASFRLRFEILRSVPLRRVQAIVAEVDVQPDLAAFIAGRPERCSVVTGNLDLWVKPLAAKLPCRWFSSRGAAGADGRVNLLEVLVKGRAVQAIKAGGGRLVAVGESRNDVSMFEEADVGVAFGGVHEPVAELKAISDYVTYDASVLCRLLSTF